MCKYAGRPALPDEQTVSPEPQKRLDEIVVAVDDGNLRVAPIRIVVEIRTTVHNGVHLGVPVAELPVTGFQHLQRGLDIEALLVLRDGLGGGAVVTRGSQLLTAMEAMT